MSIYGSNTYGYKDLNQVIQVVDNDTVQTGNITAATITADTITANTYNIVQTDTYDVIGSVYATEDVFSSWTGTGGTGISLTETAQRVGVLENSLDGFLSTTGPNIVYDDFRIRTIDDEAAINLYPQGLTGGDGNPLVQLAALGTVSSYNSNSTNCNTTYLTTKDAYFKDGGGNTVITIQPDNSTSLVSTGALKAPFFIPTFGIQGLTGNFSGTGSLFVGSDGSCYAKAYVIQTEGPFQEDYQINNAGEGRLKDVYTTTLTGGLNSYVTGMSGTVANKVDKQIGNINSYLTASGTGTTGGNYLRLSTLDKGVIYVSLAGNDSNDGFSPDSPVLTLGQGLALAGGSGKAILIYPGTYTGNYTITNPNVTISAVNLESGGIVYFSGTITVNHNSSSVRINGISINNLVHSGNASLYLFNTRTQTSFQSNGSSYVECNGCNFQGASLAGGIALSGNGVTVFNNSLLGSLTVSSSGRTVSVYNCPSCAPMLISDGLVSVRDSTVYSSAALTNAVQTSSTATFYGLNSTFLTPTNGRARLFLAGSGWSLAGCTYDNINSTLTGPRIQNTILFDAISSATGTFDRLKIPVTNNLSSLTGASVGEIAVNTTDNSLNFYDGTSWKVASTGPTGSSGSAGSTGPTGPAGGGGGFSNRARTYASTDLPNQTGDGTTQIVAFNTTSPIAYGYNSGELNVPLGRFTAANTGYYQVTASLQVIGLQSSHTRMDVWIQGSYSYGCPIIRENPWVKIPQGTGNPYTVSVTSPVFYLGTNDFVELAYAVYNGPKTVGLGGSSICTYTRIQ